MKVNPYPVVIVPSALTRMETGGRGLGAGGWGWVPSALKIAPWAGQLNCPVDALYLTGTPAWVQAWSTATKLPLLICTSQLAFPLAGLVKLAALLVGILVCPITVPVCGGGVGVGGGGGCVGFGVGCCVGCDVGCEVGCDVGDGCAPFVAEGEGFAVGD